MTRTYYVQCRLRRQRQDGHGHSELVTHLPTHGTNGTAVEVGRLVQITADRDQRLWSVLSVSESVVDAAFIQRKRDESRDLSSVIV